MSLRLSLRRFALAALAAFLNSLPGCVIAADGVLRYPAIETHSIASRHVDQTFRIQVMQPARVASDTTRWPVVYATDGNLTFEMLKGIAQLLSSSPTEPRFLLVSIGYPSDAPAAGLLLRARDLTFPGYPKLSTKPPPIEGVLTAKPGTRDFAGGEDFQRFLEDELFPLIEKTYPVQAGRRVYFGHSAGGGFGLFTLFTKPHLFSSYVVSSPGLTFHGRSSGGVDYENYDFVAQLMRRFVAEGRALGNKRLYISAGTAEEFEPILAPWRITSSLYRFVALLRNARIPGLKLTSKVWEGETHASAWPIAFIHGVRAVLAIDTLPRVALSTELGEIVVEVDVRRAPLTAQNFLRYVDGGHYDGGSFYRTVTLHNQPHSTVKIEVIQGGMAVTSSQQRLVAIALEPTSKTGLGHKAGALSMARSGPDTATSEFFICLTDEPELDEGGTRHPDGRGFAAFARVVEGMEVVRRIHAAAAEGQRLTPPIWIKSARRG